MIGTTKDKVLPEPVTAFTIVSKHQSEHRVSYLYDNVLVFHEQWDCAGLNGCHLGKPLGGYNVLTSRLLVVSIKYA